MGMIWDHHIVQNNYGHHLPIAAASLVTTVWDIGFLYCFIFLSLSISGKVQIFSYLYNHEE